jgi:hypothetical protein
MFLNVKKGSKTEEQKKKDFLSLNLKMKWKGICLCERLKIKHILNCKHVIIKLHLMR